MPGKTFSPDAPDKFTRGKILETSGPTLDLIIRGEPGHHASDGVPLFHATTALIDTGASDMCIDYRIAHALQLREIDQVQCSVVGGSIPASVYLADLEIPQIGYRKITRIIASKVARTNYNALIGRSVLSKYIVTFDGPSGCFHFYHGDHEYEGPVEDE